MIDKLIRLSKIYPPKDLIENLSRPLTAKQGFAIKISRDAFEDVIVIDQTKKLLFYDQKGNVSGKSPTVKISGSNVDDFKKVVKKVAEFFNETALQNVYETIVGNLEAITEKAFQKYSESLGKDKPSFFTVIIDGKFPEDHPIVREIFVERVMEKSKSGIDGICATCGKKTKVTASANQVFKFITFDKPGFCPNLDKSQAVKVFPICENCLLLLENASNLIKNKLTFDFVGSNLWIIPSIVGDDPEILKAVTEKIASIGIGSVEITASKTLRDFSKLELSAEEILSEEGENVLYDFLLIKQSQSQQRIELHVSEVSPTRLRKLYECSKSISKLFEENGLDISMEKSSFKPGFEQLWYLFGKPAADEAGRKEYLNLVEACFTQNQFNYDRFLWYIMKKLRQTFHQFPENLKNDALSAFGNLLYLTAINVLRPTQGGAKMPQEEGIFDSFFDKFKEFFDEPWKKAVFLTGVLVKRVMEVQESRKGKSPFLKKLGGLKMNYNQIKYLLTESWKKLQQYDAFQSSDEILFSEASKYFLQASDVKASIDLLNFVLTLGMTFPRNLLLKNFERKVEGVSVNE
ncbi:TIGR02556 family CRISPR-associated protein [Pseudothermotoga thermarum]|uniref:CRISPR-associated protein, TM1802 family n=1 Tax=Pseudothermotoga thermarum DSM 5069 TaxID=688269 RepID=F7YVS1_9THEM|nr:TIGR02556 family CRISPR-associated protein [Pseudothermotoga thermarum]AEH51740.1 CRISPR-associated protein, TM1802 family [Pseudothermotoga thermarum DSM 5069]